VTSGEHQMKRMGQEYTSDAGRPVPRVEFVHSEDPSLHHEDPTGQRWHVRYIGANGEPIAVPEQLTSQQACEVNALAMSRLFVDGVSAVESSWADGVQAMSTGDRRVPILVVEHDEGSAS